MFREFPSIRSDFDLGETDHLHVAFCFVPFRFARSDDRHTTWMLTTTVELDMRRIWHTSEGQERRDDKLHLVRVVFWGSARCKLILSCLGQASTTKQSHSSGRRI